MVASHDIHLVDATFLLEASHKAFLGAPLLTAEGQDHTFLFGIIRDLLRLRSLIGLQRGAVVVGKDGYAVTGPPNVKQTISFLRDFGIPVIHDGNQRVIDICAALASSVTHIITRNKGLLVFAGDGRRVIIPKARTEAGIIDSSTVVSKIGVAPHLVPSFLALTEGAKATVLTKREKAVQSAVRWLLRY